MIPEKEREALMRLTMCAREECIMCKYHKECDFDFQYELATENMNILADALRKLNCSEKPNNSTSSKMEQVEDEPQTDEPTMDEYYKDHDEFYDCDRYVITNDEGERAYNCIGCQTDCPWK